MLPKVAERDDNALERRNDIPPEWVMAIIADSLGDMMYTPKKVNTAPSAPDGWLSREFRSRFRREKIGSQ